MRRLLSLGVLTLFVVMVEAAVMPAAQSEAATPTAVCNRAWGTTYSCSKQLAVGNHVALYKNPGVCHGDVVSTTTSPSLKASMRIVEDVSACNQTLGTILTITYFVPTPTPTPTPTPAPPPGPPAVGGIVDLRTDTDAHSDAVASSDTLPIAASVALGALIIGAGGLHVVRLRRR